MATDDQMTNPDEVVFVDEPHVVVDAPEGEDESAQSAPTGQPTLTLRRNGADTSEVFPVSETCTVGRFDPAVGPIDIDLGNLPEGQYVSRKHAKITQEDGVWTITDLGSSNGTFVLRGDFERVDSAELADGTEIALGNARFVFRLS